MGFDAQDKEIVRLLTKLKDADGKYPPELLAARRQRYLKEMGQIGLGTGLGTGVKNAAQGGKVPALSSATSTILESALVVAIVAETGTVAYFYRDKLAEIFQTITNQEEPRVQQVSPSPVHEGQAVQGVTPSPALISTLPSATLSASPTAVEITSTPIPGVVEDNNSASADSTTPAPNVNNSNNGNNGNNGNHYGQTPKPERTKEPKNNNNNNGNNGNNNNNDKPPKDNSKPTKTK